MSEHSGAGNQGAVERTAVRGCFYERLNYSVWGDGRHFSPSFPGSYKTLVRTENCRCEVDPPPPPHSRHSANVRRPPVPTWNRLQITVLADAALKGRLVSSLLEMGRERGEWVLTGGRRSPESESEGRWDGLQLPQAHSGECRGKGITGKSFLTRFSQRSPPPH